MFCLHSCLAIIRDGPKSELQFLLSYGYRIRELSLQRIYFFRVLITIWEFPKQTSLQSRYIIDMFWKENADQSLN